MRVLFDVSKCGAMIVKQLMRMGRLGGTICFVLLILFVDSTNKTRVNLDLHILEKKLILAVISTLIIAGLNDTSVYLKRTTHE